MMVQDSIFFNNVIVEPVAKIRHVINDKEATILAEASIGRNLEADKKKGRIIPENGAAVVPGRLEV